MESAAPFNADEVFPVVYDQLRVLAGRYLSRERHSHPWQPSDLVHEAWFRLRAQRRVDSSACPHVVALGALAMRRLLADHGRCRKRLKRGGADKATVCARYAPYDSATVSAEDALAIAAALKRLAEVQPRRAFIVEMRVFSGLTVGEVADALGISKRRVEAEWTRARSWLSRELA
jgi:RNA polymerase sigma factor (TIGR02999 family)